MDPTINCDMGESFGRYRLGDDASLMPLVDLANVACGFHAADPTVMRATVSAAAEAGVAIGAHPALPDLQGFGRRAMAIPGDDLVAIVQYQVGALCGFLTAAGGHLSHIKPHGALYGMACRDQNVARAIAEAAAPFDVPVLGLAGTEQDDALREKGIPFIPEFYADLDYDDDGLLVIVPEPSTRNVGDAARRAIDALQSGAVRTINGHSVPVRAETICVHSDNPDASALLKHLRALLNNNEPKRPTVSIS
ncbi:5-oxoprolinase subunit PxpA [Bauldia sp.]|uniref:5-oxoprolinase subunit PxpA n=1 Tax=Bauldia sp. TaxID=2575872 RepID=UPI003BAA6D94